MSDLTDINFVQQPLDQTLFPGAPRNVWIHGGFAAAHINTAADILVEVQSLLASTGYTSVTTVRAPCPAVAASV
jgi:hypothetical protein